MERGLGEIDRARAIYVHASSMADPRRDPGFWADWNAFEVGQAKLQAAHRVCGGRVKRSGR